MIMKKAAWTILFLIFSNHNLEASSDDFFSNTTSVDRLSTGADGSCPGCPGFNPDRVIRHAGTDPDGAGPIQFSQMIATTAPPLGGTVSGPFFNRLGPGAITDNMFGIVSDPGGDPAACGTNTSSGVVPTAAGLNCGDLRFDPASQGIFLPAAPSTDTLSALISQPSIFTGDFFPFSDDHLGIDSTNRLVWNRTVATLADGDLSVSCAASTLTCVGGKQQQRQVTSLLPGTAGTLGAPGEGEQKFLQSIEWGITGSSGAAFTGPTLYWTLEFNDPIPDSNNQSRMETGVLSGSFTYLDGEDSAVSFPSVTAPFVRNATELCRGMADTAGTCVHIP